MNFPKLTSRPSAGQERSKDSCLSPSSLPLSLHAYGILFVSVADTVRGFKEILEGKHDELPEQAFWMVGGIEEAVEKAKKIAAQ